MKNATVSLTGKTNCSRLNILALSCLTLHINTFESKLQVSRVAKNFCYFVATYKLYKEGFLKPKYFDYIAAFNDIIIRSTGWRYH
jgi:hypothetical protein